MNSVQLKRKLVSWRTPLAAIVLFSIFFLYIIQYSNVDFEEVALQEGTLSKKNTQIDGFYIRNDVWPKPKQWDYWKELLPKGAASLIIWMGNSHLHAVNGMQDGDQVSSYELHVLLNGKTWPGKIPAFGLSVPNLSFEEQFLLTLWLAEQKNLPRPLIIISGYRYADTRTSDVRPQLKPMLKDESLKAWIQSHKELEGIFPNAFSVLRRDIEEYREALKEKEGSFEATLKDFVGKYVYVFGERSTIGGNLRIMLKDLRDWFLRIDTTNKRGVLKSRYLVSMEFMELAAYVSHEHGVKLLMYNVPIRPEVINPYPEEPYRKYKEQMQSIAKKYNPDIFYMDYEKIIPTRDWGTYYATQQPDFSHFTARGHKKYAERVERDLRKLGLLVMEN